MTSNTKLTQEQKLELKCLRVSQTYVKVVNDGKTTIAYRDRGNTVEFALSVASSDENKFRVKVGEFHARDRLYNGETVKMASEDFQAMMECVYGVLE